jgi:hypothetical protein
VRMRVNIKAGGLAPLISFFRGWPEESCNWIQENVSVF